MEKNIKTQSTIRKAFLFIVTILLIAISNNTFSQSITCSNAIMATPATGTITINGLSINTTSSGDVLYYDSTGQNCTGQSFGPKFLQVGKTSAWSITINFDKPVNNLIVALRGTGEGLIPTATERFIFNSNGGAVSIYSPSSNCASTVSGNEILASYGSNSSTGGGGLFRISAPTNFTSLTINGPGGLSGSILGFCTESLVPSINITSITPNNQSICQNTNAAPIFISATGTGNLSYQWYKNTTNSNTGGTIINGATSQSYTPVASTSNGTDYFYVIVTDSNGSSASNTATVNTLLAPNTPLVSVTNISNTCPSTTVNLTTLQPTSVNDQIYEWHTSASTPNSGNIVSNPNAVSNAGTYYLYSKNSSNGCYSLSSSAVNVTINNCTTGTCTSSGVNYVNLNSLYTGIIPNAPNTVLEWWTTSNRIVGTKVVNPTNVTISGTYYAFFYDTAGNCYNTNNSTASVFVSILPPCSICPNLIADLSAYNNNYTSESVFENNQIKIGTSRIRLTNTTALPTSLFTTNRISDTHYSGEFGINIGHNQSTGISASQKIVSTLKFDKHIGYLKFTLSDIDSGENIVVNAYDENNNLITLEPSNYSIYFSTNVKKSGNSFYDAQYPIAFDAPSQTRQGTVDINYSGKKVSKVIFEFTNNAQVGSYSISKISGEECATCTKPGSLIAGGNPTKVGITLQKKQELWPENIPNGFVALESKEKGFVITRVLKVGGGSNGTPDLLNDSIKDPKEGMVVYDINAQCVKLFNGTIWKCIEGCN